MTTGPRQRAYADQADGFGWISIGLHWVSAALVIALLVVGFGIANAADAGDLALRRNLHVSIAIAAWLLLLLRIAWRLRVPHPRARGQSARTHLVARTVHFVILAMLAVMMFSGPVLAWARSEAIVVFGRWQFPSAAGDMAAVADAALGVHRAVAFALATLVALHILAAMKHLMFHEDETIVRMLWPRRGDAALRDTETR